VAEALARFDRPATSPLIVLEIYLFLTSTTIIFGIGIARPHLFLLEQSPSTPTLSLWSAVSLELVAARLKMSSSQVQDAINPPA
jgi:AraC-like DNA-binding protein